MVSQAAIQTKVNRGLGIVATAAGVSCEWYRASSAQRPISSGNWMGALQVLFDTAPDLMQRIPRRRDKPEEWFGAFDTIGVAVGDYLTTPSSETLFIAAIDPFRPARLVLCNRTVDIRQPAVKIGYGAIGGYGGDTRAAETVLASSWPCAMVQGTKGETGDTRLPGDVKLPWSIVLLPAIPGVVLRNDLILVDDLNCRRLISQAELTPLGWRLSVVLETT
jgi:hypothetical protein